jgi:hypothetical protein
MPRSVKATKRGFGFDGTTNSLDIFANGVIATKYGGLHPSIYSPDSTQLYELGTRYQVDDRVFRYALAGTAGVNAGYGAFFYVTTTLGLGYEAVHVAADAGATSIIVTEASITANKWDGGYVVVGHNDADTTQNRRIVSNTATDGDTHVTIELDGPLHVALTTSEGVEIIPNIYSDLQTAGGQEYVSVAGVPAVTTTTGKYFWVQTWGPCWIVPGGAGTPGSTAAERTVYFQGNGTIMGDVGLVDPTTEPERRQVAGFIIQKDTAGSGGPPFIMLQVSP